MDDCNSVRQLFLDLIVVTHLDNFNELFYKLPHTDIKKLQWVQKAVAKLVLWKAKYDSVTSCMKNLDWLLLTS